MTVKVVMILGVGFIAALIGLDIYLAVDGLPGNTWSEIIRTWAKATPVIPWACGVLTGHFFHPVDNLEPVLARPGNIAMLVWLTVTVALFGVAMSRAGNPVPPWAVVLPAAVAGALLWPV